MGNYQNALLDPAMLSSHLTLNELAILPKIISNLEVLFRNTFDRRSLIKRPDASDKLTSCRITYHSKIKFKKNSLEKLSKALENRILDILLEHHWDIIGCIEASLVDDCLSVEFFVIPSDNAFIHTANPIDSELRFVTPYQILQDLLCADCATFILNACNKSLLDEYSPEKIKNKESVECSCEFSLCRLPDFKNISKGKIEAELSRQGQEKSWVISKISVNDTQDLIAISMTMTPV